MSAMNAWIDVLLKVTLLLAAAQVGLHLTRSRTSAAQRHMVWALTLGAGLLLPALARVAPTWHLPLLSPPTPVAEAARDAAPDSRLAPAALRAPTRVVDAPATRPERAAAGWPLSPASALGLAWASGALLILAPFARAAWRVSRLAHDDAAPEPEWAPLAATLADGFGLSGVRCASGPAGAMPMTWGLWPAIVLLPQEAETWPQDRLRNVLTHELAHVRRRDCLTQALARVACAVYWFHPLVWQAARRLHAERERACDDLVLGLGASGTAYADDLLQVARGLQAARHPDLMAVAMARPSELEGRLLAILDPHRLRQAPSRALAIGAASLVAALVLPLAGLSPWKSATVRAAGGDEDRVAGHEEMTSTPEPAPAPAASPAAAARAAQGARPTVEPDRIDQALRGALQDEDAEVRRQAAFALGQRRVAESAGALAEALGDAEAEVREQAAFALGELRVAEAVPALAAAVASDEDADVRHKAAFALGQIGSVEAVPALMAAVADADGEVRQQAVFALGQLRDARALPALTRALSDAADDVRQQAAFALGQLRAESAIEPLTRALEKDASPEVREQAAFALGAIGDPKAADALARALKDATPEVRKQAAFALSQLR